MLALAALQLSLRGHVPPGVKVAGVDLGGKEMGEAERTLEERLAGPVETVTLQTPKGALTLSLAALGIDVDTEATVKRAARQGRHDVVLGLAVYLPLGGADLDPVVRVDGDTYEQGLERARDKVDVAATDATLSLEGGEVSVVPGADGREVDGVALERLLFAAIDAGKPYSGPVPTKAVPPEVSTTEAAERAGAAAVYLSRPVTLRLRETSIELPPSQLAGMLSVNKGGDADLYPLTFDNDRAKATLHRLFAYAETPAQDADIVVHEQGGITVTPSRDGIVLDMAQLVADLDAAASGGGLRQVVVALRHELPELTTEDVHSMGLASLGSQFTTYFNAENPGRATNISLAAKLVDGTIVEPGEVFSLNATMGPRTENRGFDFAPVIAGDGVLRQGVGGGICQYATTLFNAVFFAGLPVVERHPHGLLIAHYPVGRDATVSWGGPDFKFRNDTGKPIMIRSWVQGEALTVAIVGKTGRRVIYTTSDYYDVRKPSSSKADPRVVYDADLSTGITRWELGADGKTVKVVRTVKDAQGKVLFRETYVSTYQPRDWIKRVGTG